MAEDDSKFYKNLWKATLWACMIAWAGLCGLLMLSVGKY